MAKIPTPDGQGGSFFADSASSQFAILLLPVLGAKEEQTIFGTVIEGMDVVSRLRRVDPHKEKKQGETQYPPDSIIEAKVIDDPIRCPNRITSIFQVPPRAVESRLLSLGRIRLATHRFALTAHW